MRCDDSSALRDPQPWLRDGRPETVEADDCRCDDERRDLEPDHRAWLPSVDDTTLSGWV